MFLQQTLTMMIEHLVIVSLVFTLSNRFAFGGLIYTDSGYDNINGVDSICWTATAHSKKDNLTYDPYTSEIPGDPRLVSSPVTKLRECPLGTEVTVKPPIEMSEGEVLRTKETYAFQVLAKLNLTSIREEGKLSENTEIHTISGETQIAGRIAFCPPNGLFCSPYIVARTAAEVNEGSETTFSRQNNLDETMSASTRFDQFLAILNATSPWQLQSINYTNEHEIALNYTFEITAPKAGAYIPLGVIQILFRDDESDTFYKVDVANLLHMANTVFQEPTFIRSLNKHILLGCFVVVGIAAVIQAFLLGFAIKCRNESVMKMSQGDFLICLQVAAFVLTCSAALLAPIDKYFCKIGTPVVMISVQFMLAIVFGRLRRINTIMGGLMKWNQKKSSTDTRSQLRRLSTTYRFSLNEERMEKAEESSRNNSFNSVKRFVKKAKKIRQNYTAAWLWITVCLVMIPQLIVQIVRLAIYESDLTLFLNEDESFGRFQCGVKGDRWINIASFGVTILTLFAALFESHKSRKLPAFFNEASSVSVALLITLLMTSMGVTVLVASTTASSPDVVYVIPILIVLNFTLNLSIRLLYPKLKLVWKGEKVVINKIMQDHKKRQEGKKRLLEGKATKKEMFQIAGTTRIFNRLNSNETPSGHPYKQRNNAMISSIHEEEAVECRSQITSPQFDKSYSDHICPDIKFDSVIVHHGDSSIHYDENSLCDNSLKLDDLPPPMHANNDNSHSSIDPSYLIVAGQAPPSEVTINIVHLASCVANINQRILSGLYVDEQEWIALRENLEESRVLLEKLEFTNSSANRFPITRRRSNTFG